MSEVSIGWSLLPNLYALGEHAKAAGNLGKVTARNGGRGLVADTELKMS